MFSCLVWDHDGVSLTVWFGISFLLYGMMPNWILCCWFQFDVYPVVNPRKLGNYTNLEHRDSLLSFWRSYCYKYSLIKLQKAQVNLETLYEPWKSSFTNLSTLQRSRSIIMKYTNLNKSAKNKCIGVLKFHVCYEKAHQIKNREQVLNCEGVNCLLIFLSDYILIIFSRVSNPTWV